MRVFTALALFMGAVMASPAAAPNPRFTVARPGGVEDIIITEENTLNGTAVAETSRVEPEEFSVAAPTLPLRLVNNFSGGVVNAYITGKDNSGRVVFITRTGGQIYPSSGGGSSPTRITQPIAIRLPARGQTLTVNLPIALDSGRIYFCEGDLPFHMVRNLDGTDGLVQPTVFNPQDPSAGLNWGFVELTYQEDGGIWANISYVDFVGMILSMALSTTDGGSQITRGLRASALVDLCNHMASQSSSDSQPWSRLCVTNSSGRVIRALSPNVYTGIDRNAFRTYYDSYVNQVWTQYTSNDLTINTQLSGSNNRVRCRVTGGVLNCAGSNRTYQRPTAADIWSCDSGPFVVRDSDNAVHRAIVPRLCAAFVRSTLLRTGGNLQPSLPATQYYRSNPTHHYSRVVHELQVDQKGYAFPYDDVNPDGHFDSSGLVSAGNPSALIVYVGAPPP